ncbi:MAG: FAD:protein FMN transferase [Prevotella sp.]|nr:FAD:protein FMN transferase [Prevotella sp.]
MENKRKKRNFTLQLAFLTFLIVGTVLIVKHQRSMPYQHNKGSVFGTFYSITYQSDEDLQKEIENELKKVDETLSMFNEQSVISKVNRNEKTELNDMFVQVIQLAMQVSEETDGAFDITVAPLVNAWGFGFKSGVHPTPHTIDSLKALVGYKKISLDMRKKEIEKKDPRIMLNCSAIAKGYGSDVVGAFLKRRGIENYMVEIGGEVVTHGVNERRVPWRIGVVKPTDDTLSVDNELQTVLNVANKSMATSGNYRNFYYKGGRKYAHTIDPKTGAPVQHSLLSATVLADNCATADAYATSFMVMGIERAKVVLERHPELMAYFIYSDNNGELAVWYSPTMKEKIIE